MTNKPALTYEQALKLAKQRGLIPQEEGSFEKFGRHTARTAKDVGVGALGTLDLLASPQRMIAPLVGGTPLPSVQDIAEQYVDTATQGYTKPRSEKEKKASQLVKAASEAVSQMPIGGGISTLALRSAKPLAEGASRIAKMGRSALEGLGAGSKLTPTNIAAQSATAATLKELEDKPLTVSLGAATLAGSGVQGFSNLMRRSIATPIKSAKAGLLPTEKESLKEIEALASPLSGKRIAARVTQIDPEKAEIVQRTQIPATVGELTKKNIPGSFIKGVQTTTERIRPDVYGKMHEKRMAHMKGKLGITEEPLSAHEAGILGQEIAFGRKEAQSKLQNELASQLPKLGNKPVDVTQVLKEIEPYESLGKQAYLNLGSDINRIKSSVAPKEGIPTIPFDELVALNESLRTFNPAAISGNVERSLQKDILKPVRRVISSEYEKAGAGDIYKRKGEAYKKFKTEEAEPFIDPYLRATNAQWEQVGEKGFKDVAKSEPTKGWTKVMSDLKNDTGKDINYLLSHAKPNQVKDILGNVFDSLSTSKAGQSPLVFEKSWRNLPKESQDTLLKHAGIKSSEMEDYLKMVENLKDYAKLANTSGTSSHEFIKEMITHGSAIGIAGATGAAAPLSLLGTIPAAAVAYIGPSKFFTNPKLIKAAIAGSKASSPSQLKKSIMQLKSQSQNKEFRKLLDEAQERVKESKAPLKKARLVRSLHGSRKKEDER